MMIAGLLLAAAAPAGQQAWHITPDGWGPVRIGMSRAEVEAAIGTGLEGEPIEKEEYCVEMVPQRPDQGVWFMFQEHKLTRISIGEPSRVTTPRGIGIGSGAGEVRRAYGRGLTAEPHKYEDLPSEYLTFWTAPEKRGVRFETDSNRQVQAIHGGDESIQYVEGCA